MDSGIQLSFVTKRKIITSDEMLTCHSIEVLIIAKMFYVLMVA